MKIKELQDATTGPKTAEFDLVIEAPGTTTSSKKRLWSVYDVRRDNANKRVILQVDELINEESPR